MSSKPKAVVSDPRFLTVVDIEATCWETGKQPEKSTHSDIIEIGWARVDVVNRTIEDRGTLLVRPQRSTVSKYCTDLTTITKDMLFAEGNEAMNFREACAYLRTNIKTQQYPWASWGMYDYRMFVEHCDSLDVQWPFGSNHLNVKSMYQTLFAYEDEYTAAAAVDNTVGGFEGTLHRGGDDAYNMARVVCWLGTIFKVGLNANGPLTPIQIRQLQDHAETL